MNQKRNQGHPEELFSIPNSVDETKAWTRMFFYWWPIERLKFCVASSNHIFVVFFLIFLSPGTDYCLVATEQRHTDRIMGQHGTCRTDIITEWDDRDSPGDDYCLQSTCHRI